MGQAEAAAQAIEVAPVLSRLLACSGIAISAVRIWRYHWHVLQPTTKTAMQTFTTEYAAQHLDELLDLVARGETVMLSLNGVRLPVWSPSTTDGDAEVPLSEVEEAFHGD
jgi:hypothetical protein